jgi:CRP/FNR family cyclic AMP-dependent transcriptional regulator
MQTGDLLGMVPLFQRLSVDERADLERVLERRTFAAGEQIFSIGEPGDSLYIVGTGVIELFVKDDAGSRIVLTACAPGEVFGELSLFDGGPRTASAVALEEATLLVLDRDDLLAFLSQHPAASLDLLTTMGQRIRSTDEILRRRVARNINEEMEIRSTTVERVADVIAAFSGSISFLVSTRSGSSAGSSANTLPFVRHFDPYPFGFLTMVVSLEAIFLSIFVLVSQNRQAAKDRLRADAEYEVNLKAELEIRQLHEKIDFLTEADAGADAADESAVGSRRSAVETTPGFSYCPTADRRLPTVLAPAHLERARLVAVALALRLGHRGVGAAVAEDRFEKVAEGAGAVEGAVARIVRVDHARAVGGLLETHRAELLILVVKHGVVLEELHEAFGVERAIDAADAELRGCGADEREHVRVLGLQFIVNGLVELDQRFELAPARCQRRLHVTARARRQLFDQRRESFFADELDEELLPSAEHHALDLGDRGIGADQHFLSFESRRRSGGLPLHQK